MIYILTLLPLEKQIPSLPVLYCKRVGSSSNNKMYLDNYHLLANTTPARHGKEQKRKFIYTENRSSCRVGYSWNWALERVLLVSQSESVVGGTELSLPCPAPLYQIQAPATTRTCAPPSNRMTSPIVNSS